MQTWVSLSGVLKWRYGEHTDPSVAFLDVHRRDVYRMMSRAQKKKIRSSEAISTDKYKKEVTVQSCPRHVSQLSCDVGCYWGWAVGVRWGQCSDLRRRVLRKSYTDSTGFGLQSSRSIFTL